MTAEQCYCARTKDKYSRNRFSPAIIAALGHDKKSNAASGRSPDLSINFQGLKQNNLGRHETLTFRAILKYSIGPRVASKIVCSWYISNYPIILHDMTGESNVYSFTSQLRKSSLTSNSESSLVVLGAFQPRPLAPSYSCCSMLPPFFECPSPARISGAFSLFCECALEELLGRRSKLGDRYFPVRLCLAAASVFNSDSR